MLGNVYATGSRRLLVVRIFHDCLMLSHFGRLKFNIHVLLFVYIILLIYDLALTARWFIVNAVFHILLILIELRIVRDIILE